MLPEADGAEGADFDEPAKPPCKERLHEQRPSSSRQRKSGLRDAFTMICVNPELVGKLDMSYQASKVLPIIKRKASSSLFLMQDTDLMCLKYRCL